MGKLFRTKNITVIYLIAICVIIVAFLLLGGDTWFRGLGRGSRSTGLGNLQWIQILISLGIGFVLGLLFARRKW